MRIYSCERATGGSVCGMVTAHSQKVQYEHNLSIFTVSFKKFKPVEPPANYVGNVHQRILDKIEKQETPKVSDNIKQQ